MHMTKLEADFRIVTPLFMSGADPQSAELRVPGIKGVLRFWWRALELKQDCSDDDAVKNLRKMEASIFGSVDTGQSAVKISLNLPGKLTLFNSDQKIIGSGNRDFGAGAKYLGYGVIQSYGKNDGHPLRQVIGSPLEGRLNLLFKPKTDDKIIRSIEAALIAMGFFGGLGSKSRKGYGAFNLTDLKKNGESVFRAPEDTDNLKRAIKELFSNYEIPRYPGLPPYTAYSEMTRIDIIGTDETSLKLLDSIGRAMMLYRSYGRDGKVLGQDSEKNFKDDHDLIRRAISCKVSKHPRRIVFGLPHNYFFSNGGEKVDVKPKDHERRASPLFIHIQQLKKDEYAAVVAIFPSEFLPKGEKILVRDSLVDMNIDYTVLNEFIDGKGNKPRFKKESIIAPILTPKGVVH